jgi:phage tail protein X
VPFLRGPHEQSAGQQIVVRANDSISYLALRHYGFYSDSVLAVLQRANPHIPDWQQLKTGETIAFPALPAAAPRLEELRSEAALAVLTFFEGEVKYLRGLSRQYQPVKLNLILRPGDEILTAKNGRAELVLDQRSVLRLEANSHLRIAKLARDRQAQGSYQGLFDLTVGSLWASITKTFGRAPQVDLQFPTAIAGVQGTSYRARVEADSSTNVRVYEGAVEVRNRPAGPPQQIGPPQRVPGPQQITLEAWIKLVPAQQEINVAKNGRPGEPQPFTDRGAEAAWVNWNQTRDRDLNAGR